MSKSVATKTSTAVAPTANKYQKAVFDGWRAWRDHIRETGSLLDRIEIIEPKLCGTNVEFKYDGLGLLSGGLIKGADMLRWFQDNVKGYDENKVIVYLRMNGNLYPVRAADDEQNCKDTVERVNKERSDAYKKTPEYAAQLLRDEERHMRAADLYKKVVRELRPDFDYLDMGRWLVRFIDAQDAVGSGLDPEEMFVRFESMGYLRNEGITDPPTRPVGLEATIRYVVGQVMSFYRPEPGSDYKPCVAHPRLGEFAADAVKLHLESGLEGPKKDEQKVCVDRNSDGSNSGGM